MLCDTFPVKVDFSLCFLSLEYSSSHFVHQHFAAVLIFFEFSHITYFLLCDVTCLSGLYPGEDFELKQGKRIFL